MPDTIKIIFNLDIDPTDKTRSIDNNLGSALMNKKVLMLQSEETDTINNADICNSYKDLYFSEKTWREAASMYTVSTPSIETHFAVVRGLPEWLKLNSSVKVILYRGVTAVT